MENNKQTITGLDPPIGYYNYIVENSCKLELQPSPRKGKCDEKQIHVGEIDISCLYDNRNIISTSSSKNASYDNWC